MMKTIIIGAGPAGVKAAETLREEDKKHEIIMLSSEPYPPYSPPAMVQYFLTGEALHYWRGQDFPELNNIDYRQGSHVVSVSPDMNEIELESGEKLAYDYLVIAAGSRLYTPVEGSDKKGIHNFKSLKAGDELLAKVRSGEVSSALIVGAGFIGVEVALMLKKMELDVTMLVRSRVMRSMLDPETSTFVQCILEDREVKILRGDDADAVAFPGDNAARAVQMKSGKELTADLLVAATGLKPNIEFLSGSGIETDWGVFVDQYLCTNIPNIYAAGDITETFDRLTGERYSHANYPNAITQGNLAGLNILGYGLVYDGSENMNSMKHLDVPVIAAGLMEGEEIRLHRNGSLRKLWVKDNKLVGCRLAGDITGAGIFINLIRRGVDISPIRDNLSEPNFCYTHIHDTALMDNVIPS